MLEFLYAVYEIAVESQEQSLKQSSAGRILPETDRFFNRDTFVLPAREATLTVLASIASTLTLGTG